MEPACVPGVSASPSAPLPWRPGYCTHVPEIFPKMSRRSISSPSYRCRGVRNTRRWTNQ